MDENRKGPQFSRVWATVPGAMVRAGATGAEWAVFCALVRYQDGGDEVCRPVRDIAEECGLSVSTVRNAIRSLTLKTFPGADGEPVPVLSRVGRGHNGRTARYRVNVPREWASSVTEAMTLREVPRTE